MIGVAANESDLPWVTEFFELFKTPWEPVRPGTRYRVVLSTRPDADVTEADLTLVYGADERPVDRRFGAAVEPLTGETAISWRDPTAHNQTRIPG